jgi:hypothetical protein
MGRVQDLALLASGTSTNYKLFVQGVALLRYDNPVVGTLSAQLARHGLCVSEWVCW